MVLAGMCTGQGACRAWPVSRWSRLEAAQSVRWWFWHFVCMLLFFSNQEAGFGICLSHSWDLVGDARSGLGCGGQSPPGLSAKDTQALSSQGARDVQTSCGYWRIRSGNLKIKA